MLFRDDATGEEVVLRTGSDVSIKEAESAAAHGGPYETIEQARSRGETWLSILKTALAAVNIGADFGLRSLQGGRFTEAGLAMLRQNFPDVNVMNDEPGVMVYQGDGRQVRFYSGSARGSVIKPAARVVKAVELAMAVDEPMSEERQVAYDLYAASFSQPSPDARFLLLMLAMEAMIEPLPREQAVVNHVAKLEEATRNAELPQDQRQSLLNSLEFLRKESISQAGRRLVRTLGERRYAEMSPSRFFTDSYALRSRLVHGAHPLPTLNEINHRAAPLEVFVSNLLALRLLDELES